MGFRVDKSNKNIDNLTMAEIVNFLITDIKKAICVCVFVFVANAETYIKPKTSAFPWTFIVLLCFVKQ